jgi:hypothetical protein
VHVTVREPGCAEPHDAAGAVVVVEDGLEAGDDLGMILAVRLRAHEPFLLAGPVADTDGPLGTRIRLLQDAHRLEHREASGAVVGRARRAVPRIEVRGEQHVLVGLLGAGNGGDGVEHRLLAEELRIEIEAKAWLAAALSEAEDEPVVLAAQ